MAQMTDSGSRDHILVGPLWEGCHESRRFSRVTYPESYITKYVGEVSHREKMALRETDPESYVTECTLVYEGYGD